MLVATKWNDIKTCIGLQVQLSWGCIQEWRKARQRTGYSNWQGPCNNENFALFSCCETRLVEKKQSSLFSKLSLSLLTSCISVLSWKFGNDWKGAIASASVQNEVFPKMEEVTLLTRCSSLEIRKSLKPLLLQIKRSQPRWLSHVSRKLQKKLPYKFYLPKQIGKKAVRRPRTTAQ